MTDSLVHQLDVLLREDAAAADARLQQAFDRQVGPGKQSLILFGSGTCGRGLLDDLRKVAIEPVAFADNNPALWGQRMSGLRILSPKAAVEEFGATAVFVVSVFTAAPLRQQLRDMKVRWATAASLRFRHAGTLIPFYAVDLPSRVLAHAAEVRKGYSIWADDTSRQEYLAQVHYRIDLTEKLPAHMSAESTYFPQDLIPLGREVFVDCGAFDGDCIRALLPRLPGEPAGIVAIEPDPGNFKKLSDYLATLPAELQKRTKAHQVATGTTRQILRFDASGTVNSSAVTAGTISVQSVPLDDLLADVVPTYIKMDIEGAEPQTLVGAANTIRRHHPALAICLYHAQDHLWRIPLYIKSLYPDYRMFLRRHSDDCWEQVCYAIPPQRLPAGFSDLSS